VQQSVRIDERALCRIFQETVCRLVAPRVVRTLKELQGLEMLLTKKTGRKALWGKLGGIKRELVTETEVDQERKRWRKHENKVAEFI
jgi:hypothetical protein